MIHLYALCAGPGDLADLRGVDDAPVHAVEVDRGLVAVHSEHARRPVPTRERALRHFEVVTAACRRCERALPVRYGEVHHDLPALCEALRADTADLRARLDRVGGHVEILVRLAAPPRTDPVPAEPSASEPVAVGAAPAPPDAEAPGAGRAYLQARRDAEARTAAAHAAAVTTLRRPTQHLAVLAAEVVERAGPTGPERCFRVIRHDAEQLLATARTAAATSDDDLVVGGPWPPYTFA